MKAPFFFTVFRMMYIRMTFYRRSMCKCDGILCCPPLHHSDILCAEEDELRFLCVTRISQSDCSRDPLIGGRSRMCAYRRNCRRSNGCVLNTRDSNPFEITIMLGGHCGQWLRYTRNTGLIPFRFGHRVNGRMKGSLPQTDLLSYFCLRYSPTTGCIVSSLFIGLTSFSCAGKTKDA